MISSSGVCTGAKSTFVGTPPRSKTFGTSPWISRPKRPSFSCSISSSYWRQTWLLWKTKTWFRFLWVSVKVKFADPESSAGLPGVVALPSWKSRRTNFWWKIFGLKSPFTSMSERSSAARILRLAARSVSSSSHWTRRSACSARLARLRRGSLRRLAAQRAPQVVLLEEEVDADAAPARVEDRLGDRLRVELLHRDVERGARAAEEVDDHDLEVVGRAELLRPDVGLDLAVRECRH